MPPSSAIAGPSPGARGIEVFKAKKDIQGKRASVRYDYGDAMQSTLPAGEYLVEAERDGVKTEGTVTVIAGERAEITIP